MNMQTMPFAAQAAKPAPTFAKVLPQRWEREAAASAASRDRGSSSDDLAQRQAAEEWFGKAMERSDRRLAKDIASAVIAGPADAIAIIDYLLAEQQRDPVYIGDVQNFDQLLGVLRSYLGPGNPDATIAGLFAEWWRLDQHTEPATEAEDNANNDRMRELAARMNALPTITAADLAMKTIAETYHGSFTMEDGNSLMAHIYGLAGVGFPKHILREMQEAAEEDGADADVAMAEAG